MKRSVIIWQVAGFMFTSVVGVLFHFLFDFTNGNVLAALISPVNESIWEHTKLMFFPMLLFATIQSRFMKEKNINFWCIKLIGIVTAVVLIPAFYYILKSILGVVPDIVNIVIFFAVAFSGYLLETILLNKNFINCKHNNVVVLILICIIIGYVVLTFVPPHVPLFEDPVNNTYGYM